MQTINCSVSEWCDIGASLITKGRGDVADLLIYGRVREYVADGIAYRSPFGAGVSRAYRQKALDACKGEPSSLVTRPAPTPSWTAPAPSLALAPETDENGDDTDDEPIRAGVVTDDDDTDETTDPEGDGDEPDEPLAASAVESAPAYVGGPIVNPGPDMERRSGVPAPATDPDPDGGRAIGASLSEFMTGDVTARIERMFAAEPTIGHSGRAAPAPATRSVLDDGHAEILASAAAFIRNEVA